MALVLLFFAGLHGGQGGRAARAQFFSPGPLSRPHAALEGLNNCARCHDPERRSSPQRCLSCHTELAPEIAKHTGFHGRMAADTGDECQRCHPDHRGIELDLITWPGEQKNFDHERTGARLKGKHAAIACADCHARAKVVVPEIRSLLAAEPHRRTFLGLSPRCSSCHADEHRGQLGRECQHCHSETSWRPDPPFDHGVRGATAFPLRGKHEGLACGKCHPVVEDGEQPPRSSAPAPVKPTFLQLKPIEHEGCASCHDDPHRENFGARCATCHSDVGWKTLKTPADARRDFHARTAFPLLGAHVEVACRACHGPSPGHAARFKGLAFAQCRDCHADAHVGQLSAAPGKPPPDCAACHDVDGFAPARFELEQHASTKFPLEGAHSTAACRGCHALDPGLAGRLPPAVRVRLAREKRPLRISLAVMRPKVTPRACSTCHVDVHQGQFASRAASGAPKGSPPAAAPINDGCRSCHRTSSFSDLQFSHDADTGFPLTGAHRSLPCASCHIREGVRPNGPVVTRYRPMERACANCHADVHQGQFRWATPAAAEPGAPGGWGTEPGDCARCHTTTRFANTLFSHGDPRFTRFELRGRHASLPCAACHRAVEAAPGVTTIRYRPLGSQCADCHVDAHRGDFRGFEP